MKGEKKQRINNAAKLFNPFANPKQNFLDIVITKARQRSQRKRDAIKNCNQIGLIQAK